MAKRRIGHLAIVLLAASIGLSVYAATRPPPSVAAATGLALDAPLPASVPPGVTLTIGDPTTEQVLKHTGWIRNLPFQVKWAEIYGGPAVTEAFHAKVLDVGTGANIPPIHAVWVGLPVRMIAVRLREDPRAHPAFVLAVAPGVKLTSLADLRGKRIAYSPGQVQGEIIARTLQSQGLTAADVRLIELPSTSADVYINALAGGAIDVAPISSGPAARRYVQQFGAAGGRLIAHGAPRDDLAVLYVREETLRDPAKAAALREYARVWGRAQQWISDHPEEWAKVYYVGREGLSPEAAREAVRTLGKVDIPAKWGPAIAYEQSSIDLMAETTGRPRFPAEKLFDRRFEGVAAQGAAVELAAR